MPTITYPNEAYTIIATVDAPAPLMPQLEAHARAGLLQFRKFDGFVGCALHKSTDGSRLVQYVQWENETYYLSCVNHPRWETFPSTKRFMEILESGEATMDVRTYNVVASADVPAG